MFRTGLLTVALLGVMGATIPAAQGAVVFKLDQSVGFGSGPFGTVTLNQTSPTLVTVVETLFAGVNWAGTGAGEALEFNIAGDPAINIAISNTNNNQTNFAAGVGGADASPYGTFDYFIHCITCQGGSGPGGTLTFTVSLASNAALDINSFKVLSTLPPGNVQAYVASDICFQASTGACTANVAAINSSTVPEPITSGLVGTGLVSLFFLRRRFTGKA